LQKEKREKHEANYNKTHKHMHTCIHMNKNTERILSVYEVRILLIHALCMKMHENMPFQAT